MGDLRTERLRNMSKVTEEPDWLDCQVMHVLLTHFILISPSEANTIFILQMRKLRPMLVKHLRLKGEAI